MVNFFQNVWYGQITFPSKIWCGIITVTTCVFNKTIFLFKSFLAIESIRGFGWENCFSKNRGFYSVINIKKEARDRVLLFSPVLLESISKKHKNCFSCKINFQHLELYEYNMKTFFTVLQFFLKLDFSSGTSWLYIINAFWYSYDFSYNILYNGMIIFLTC